jgi:hypothetical protein
MKITPAGFCVSGANRGYLEPLVPVAVSRDLAGGVGKSLWFPLDDLAEGDAPEVRVFLENPSHLFVDRFLGRVCQPGFELLRCSRLSLSRE